MVVLLTLVSQIPVGAGPTGVREKSSTTSPEQSTAPSTSMAARRNAWPLGPVSSHTPLPPKRTPTQRVVWAHDLEALGPGVHEEADQVQPVAAKRYDRVAPCRSGASQASDEPPDTRGTEGDQPSDGQATEHLHIETLAAEGEATRVPLCDELGDGHAVTGAEEGLHIAAQRREPRQLAVATGHRELTRQSLLRCPRLPARHAVRCSHLAPPRRRP